MIGFFPAGCSDETATGGATASRCPFWASPTVARMHRLACDERPPAHRRRRSRLGQLRNPSKFKSDRQAPAARIRNPPAGENWVVVQFEGDSNERRLYRVRLRAVAP